MAETFKLPASSYEEVLKLIQAYAGVKEGVALSLDQINQSTGVPRTVVSKNNGFLVQVGLITEGNKKAATDIGRALGRAYASKVDYEVERIWKEIISNNDFLSRMISAVRIRNGMDRTNYINHIIYSSGLKDSKESRAGAGAVIEILKSVNVLDEVDGKMIVKDLIENNQSGITEDHNDHNSPAVVDHQNITSVSLPAGANSVTINININCTVSEMDELAAKLKALLENLSR
ncbi:MAG: hypothetical protein IKI88_00615 [Anaerotignum sp.]|nr:hypothetical protein [Anaerotignum sp.]